MWQILQIQVSYEYPWLKSSYREGSATLFQNYIELISLSQFNYIQKNINFLYPVVKDYINMDEIYFKYNKKKLKVWKSVDEENLEKLYKLIYFDKVFFFKFHDMQFFQIPNVGETSSCWNEKFL